METCTKCGSKTHRAEYHKSNEKPLKDSRMKLLASKRKALQGRINSVKGYGEK